MKRLGCILILSVVGAVAIVGGSALSAHAQHGGTVAMAFAQVFGRARGGNLAPCREIYDPYPEFNGIGLDPAHNLAAMSDTNLKSLLVYPMSAGGADALALTPNLQQIKGPDTYISYAAGVAFDPVRRKLCVTENDIGDDVACFPYGANGDYQAQVLAVPHGAYGLAFSQRLKQMAVAVEHNEQIIFYRTGATGAELPLRAIRGPHTGMADPHGLYWDETNHEIAAVNHGNWSQAYWDLDYQGGGHYQPPSITIFAEDAKGDAAPLRTIQGSRTQLDWPTGIAVDARHNEIAVANTAGGSVLIFSRTARGNVAPLRVIKGPRSAVTIPMGVAFDPLHDQLWVANFGHTALVFNRLAQGNTPPVRVVRNAPAGTPMAGFGNPFTVAYDSKRDELIVPN